MEELVVTAKQHIDDLQNAPVAVTTFNAEQRNLISANTVADLVALTPGVTLSGNGMNMRGIGRETSETAALGSDPAVAYYVNGFYSVVAGVVGESTLYSESVQFERGPQGTRFGRNAIAGTTSLFARHPTSTVQGEGVLQYGTNGFSGIGFNMAGPITDRYGVRVGYQHFDAQRSIQHNIFPGVTAGGLARNDYFELQFEGRPTDNLHFWLRSTTFSFNNPSFYTVPPAYNTTASMGALVPNPTFGYTTPIPRDPRAINVDERGVDRLRDNMVHIFNADYDFGGAKLYYVGGYAQYQALGYSDLDRAGRVNYTACTPSATVTCAAGTAPFPGVANGTIIATRQEQDYNNRNHYFTHELRLESNGHGPLDWVVGLFYLNSFYNESYEQTEPNEPALANPIVSFSTFASAAPNPTRAFYQQQNVRKTDSRAVFGDVTYHLNSAWEVTAGLRYTVEKAVGTTQIRYIFFNPAFGRSLDVTPGTPSGAAGRGGATLTLRNPATTGRFVVTYHPSDDTLIYGQYSRGFRAGAFNMGNINSPTNNIAGPETLDALEAGWKQQLSPNLRGDATVFYYDYKNHQVPVSFVSNGIITPGFVNIPKSRDYGLEVQGTWTPAKSIWLNANYTYLNAEITHACCFVDLTNPATSLANTGGRGVSLDGNPLPRAPHHKASVSGAYTWDFAAGSLILGGSVSYLSSQNQGSFNNPNFLIPSYTLANASITWRSADNRYDLVLQGSNVLDRLYYTNLEVAGNGAGGVNVSRTYGAPRFVQAELRYRW